MMHRSARGGCSAHDTLESCHETSRKTSRETRDTSNDVEKHGKGIVRSSKPELSTGE